MQILRGNIDTQEASSLNIGVVNAGDSLKFELTIMMNGEEINLDESTFELLSRKSDGNEVRQKENITFSNGVVNIVCRQQISTCSGLVTNQLIIKNENRISTCLFYFYVGRSLEREILQSIRDVEVLDQLEEYISVGFDNLKEFEKRILTAEENIRALDNEIKGNEEKRNAAEATRSNQEQTRVSNESKRVTAEIERDRQEKNRSTSEDTRTQAETNRNSSEATRVNNEKNRTDEEGKRKSAEANRVNAESTRVINETNRSTAENNRKTAESSRVDAEINRVNAESKRVENFNAMKLENDSFKDDVDSKVSSMEQSNTTFKEEVNNKVGGIEESYFEDNVYPTGREALNQDLEFLNRKMNEAQLLEYTGASLTADKTFSGMTDDLTIKGRTLQNIIVFTGFNGSSLKYFDLYFGLKANTVYTRVAVIEELVLGSLASVSFYDSCNNLDGTYKQYPWGTAVKSIGTYVTKFTTTSNTVNKYVINPQTDFNSAGGRVKFKYFLLLEGDYTSTPINELPYFEGIQSVGELVGDKYRVGVKSHGKNIFEVDKFKDFNNHKANTGVATYDKAFEIKARPNTVYTGSTFVNGTVTNYLSIINELGTRINITTGTGGTVSRQITTGISGKLYFAVQNSTQDKINTLLNEVTNIQLEESATSTPYEPYKEDSKYILLNQPIRALPDASDEVLEDGTEIRRIEEIILNGTREWRVWSSTGVSWNPNKKVASFGVKIPTAIDDKTTQVISDRFAMGSGKTETHVYYTSDLELIGCYYANAETNQHLAISISLEKLGLNESNWSSQYAVTKLKEWLDKNNVKAYICRKEPIVTKHNKVMNIKTFEGTTHIHSTNYLPSKIKCKVPTNVQAVIQKLSIENKELNNKLKNTQSYTVNEVQNLTNMDTNLVATSWDMDFRLCDIEWALEQITNSKTIDKIKLFTTGGINNMALSRYEQAKIMILGGVYEREKLTYQLDTYLKRGYITQAEYDDLISLMDARETVEAIK